MSATPRRRTWALIAGVVVLVGFLVAAVALWLAADQRYDDNVAGFARAPMGCDTTLDFDGRGEFVLYIETTGTVDAGVGDCEVAETYAREPDGLPRPELVLRDPNGEDLSLDPTGGVDYDTGDFVGTAYRLVDIEVTGDHVLTVGDTGGEPFAMAIGRDPNGGVALLRWGAAGAVMLALVGGGVLLVLGSRRPPVAPAAPAPWKPTHPASPHHDGWPSSPPGFPTPPPTTGASGPAGAPPTTAAPPAPWAPPAPPPN